MYFDGIITGKQTQTDENLDITAAVEEFYGEDGAIGALESIATIEANFEAIEFADRGVAIAKDGNVAAGVESLSVAASLYGSLESFMGTIPSQEAMQTAPEAVVVAATEAKESIMKRAWEAIKIAFRKVQTFMGKMVVSAIKLFKNDKKKFEELSDKLKNATDESKKEEIELKDKDLEKVANKVGILASANGNKIDKNLVDVIAELLNDGKYKEAIGASMSLEEAGKDLEAALKDDNGGDAEEVVNKVKDSVGKPSVKLLDNIISFIESETEKPIIPGTVFLTSFAGTSCGYGAVDKDSTANTYKFIKDKITLSDRAVKLIKADKLKPTDFETLIKNGASFADKAGDMIDGVYETLKKFDEMVKNAEKAASDKDADETKVKVYESLVKLQRSMYKIIPGVLFDTSRGILSFTTNARLLAETYCKDLKKK